MAKTGNPIRRYLTLAVLVTIVAGGPPAAASAGWTEGFWSSALHATGLATNKPMPPLAALGAFLAAQPEPPNGVAVLAGHAGAEGHWTFLNRRGESFTVGTPDEMKRMLAALAPDAAQSRTPPTLYLAPETVFERAVTLTALPAGVVLRVVIGSDSYALARSRGRAGEELRAIVRPRLHIAIGERAAFDEALRQLARPLDKRLVRVLSLEPGGPQTLPRAPQPDPASGRPPGDVVDPFKLSQALSALRGQTLVISARINNDLLAFRPASGREMTILAAELTQAAARAGVDLVIVQSLTPHQPGVRNWLWLRFQIDGLDKALGRASFADFLETLAGGRDAAVLAATRQGSDRVVLTTAPAGGEGAGGLLQEMAVSITGNIAASAIEAHLTSSAQRRELSLRLVPMVPSMWQAVYAGGLVMGLMGLGVARRWWTRLWPAEHLTDYAGAAGFHAARIAGFTLSPMIHRPRAHELIIGMSVDANFGPMIMFGAGGTAVEVVVDTSLALPPLDPQLARDLIPSSLMFDPSNPHDPGV